MILIRQINGILHTVSLGVEGRIRLQLYNCTSTARMLSQKLRLVGILVEHETRIIEENEDGLQLQMSNGTCLPSGDFSL